MEKDIYKTSRFMYILEAALEYFISLMISGAYLAKLTTEIGMSDATTGIISSLGSLASCFQIMAIFLFANRNVKRPLSILYPLARLGFIFLYSIPFLDIPQTVQTAVFIAVLFLGRLITNAINSPKINWFMSLVDDHKRGSFTANKEIVSLLGGMIFSYAMGRIVDWLEAAGRNKESFIVCGITIFVLTILHTATLLVAKEKPISPKENIPIRQLLPELVKDTVVLKVILVSVLWTVATYMTTPFESTYRIKELGFSMTFISVASMVYSFVRVLISKPLGRFADKNSFAKMLSFCFSTALIAFAVNAFTVPGNGAPMYIVYNIFYGISMAGINSGSINLIYEHVSKEKRVCALALKNAIVGLAGFGTTLAASRLVNRIQANGNRLFGFSVYAQQVTSAITVVIIAGILIYLNTVIKKLPQQNKD